MKHLNLMQIPHGLLLCSMWLSGCSGSGGSDTGNGSVAAAGTSPSATISGIAAVGAPIGGTLYLEDANGTVKQSSVSASDGHYSVDLSGMSAPYFLKFTESSGLLTLYSMAGQAGTANLNPLSNLIVVATAQGIDASVQDPATVFNNPARFKNVSSVALKTAATQVMARLSAAIKNKLQTYGAANNDPIGDPFTLGSGLDKMFDEADVELDQAKTFMYQIQALDQPLAIDQLRAPHYQMLVVDPTSTNQNQTSFDTPGMVKKLKLQGNGAPRLVIAYIDIGEAENYRTYWGANWVAATDTSRGQPDFIIAKDPDGWSGNFPVAFWDSRWKALWLGDNGLVAQMAKSGFDGVYLDWVEAYSDPKVSAAAALAGVDPANEMMAFIEQIRAAGRKIRPDFKVMAQNAIYLIDKDPARYLKAIDAIGVEDTWYRGIADAPWGDPRGGDIANTSTDEFSTQNRVAQFQKYITAGKPVFTIDYSLQAGTAAAIYQAAAKTGARPLVTQISLSQLTMTPPPGL